MDLGHPLSPLSNASDINRDKAPPNVLGDCNLRRVLISHLAHLVAPDQSNVGIGEWRVLLAPAGLAIKQNVSFPPHSVLERPPFCSNHGHNHERNHRRHRCYPSRDQVIYPRCRLDQLVPSVSSFAVDLFFLSHFPCIKGSCPFPSSRSE